MDIAHQHFSRLVESLQLVAADYAVQRAALPAFVLLPDEIALTFDSAMRLTDQIADAGLLTIEQMTLLRDLDALFAEKSGRNHLSFWKGDALQNDGMWQTTRALARRILRSLNQPIRPPELGWITYVSARPRD